MKAQYDAATTRLKLVAKTERVYPPNEVPASPVTPYYVLGIDSGVGVNRRRGGQTTSDAYTLTVNVAGKTHGEVMTGLERADEAFKNFSLTVPGFDCTAARRDIAALPYRDPDGGSLLVGLHTYPFTSSPA